MIPIVITVKLSPEDYALAEEYDRDEISAGTSPDLPLWLSVVASNSIRERLKLVRRARLIEIQRNSDRAQSSAVSPAYTSADMRNGIPKVAVADMVPTPVEANTGATP